MIGKTFVPIHIFFLGTCDGTELVSNGMAEDGNVEAWLIGDSLGYLYGLEVGGTEDTELSIPCGGMIGITLGTYDDT